MFKKIAFALAIPVFLALGYPILGPSHIISKEFVVNQLKQPSSKFYKWRDLEIHYTDEGEGIPLLMIHGFTGSHKNFQKLNDLMKQNFRIIRVDLPGFGLSDFPEKDENYLAMYQDFIFDFVAHLNLRDYYLIGNSMGGGISCMHTQAHPENMKGLVLLASAGYDMQSAKKNAVKILRFDFVEKLLSNGIPLVFNQNIAKRTFYNDDLINDEEVKIKNMIWNKEGNLKAIFRLAQSENFPDESLIKEIKVPTLVIWGKQDEILDVKYAANFKRDIANCRLVIYDSCGHVPMIEKVDNVKSDLEQFIRETH
jgi:pimeloyl-ACP methyl ester carboxylesterase